MTTPEFPITLEVGDGTVSAVFAGPEDSFATLVVAHGAGAGMDHPFLVGFTRALNSLGVATLREGFAKGLIDRAQIAVSPVLLGAGENLWDGLDLPALGYRVETVLPTEDATHLALVRA